MTTTLAFLFEKPLAKQGGSWTSAAASVRLRALIPALSLSNEDASVKLLSTEKTERLRAGLDELSPDLIVIGKIFRAESIGIVESYLRDIGKPVILDICDNHLEAGESHALQKAIFPIATALSVNSVQMALQLENRFVKGTKPILLIPDPPDITEYAPPHDNLSLERVRLLVFGNKKNGEWLHKQLVTFPSPLPFRVDLEFHSTVDDEIWEWLDRFRDLYRSYNIDLTASYWNGHRLQEEAIARSDAIFLPGELSDLSYTKSENRLLVAFARGRLPICYGQPSYRKFDGCAVITDTLYAGLLKLHSLTRAEIHSRISIGQSIVKTQFAPEIVIRPLRSCLQKQINFEMIFPVKSLHIRIDEHTSVGGPAVIGKRFDRFISSLNTAVSDPTLSRLSVGTLEKARFNHGVRLPQLKKSEPDTVEHILDTLNPELLAYAVYALGKSGSATPSQLRAIFHPTLLPEPEFYFEGPPSMLVTIADALKTLQASFEASYAAEHQEHLFWAIDRVLMHVASCLLAQLIVDLDPNPFGHGH